jgi:hypothetical protein
MLNFIAASQLGESAPDERSVGFWQNRVQAVEAEEFFDETDLFSALHTVMMVEESAQHFPLFGFDQIKGRFAPQLIAYMNDAGPLYKNAGIVNFWPRRIDRDGEMFHNFTTDFEIIRITGIPDLRSDFDDSALTYIWRLKDNQPVSQAFIQNLPHFWDAKTGAFFTWYDSARTNTIDCVVNLNVLHAIARSKAQTGVLSEILENQKRAAEKYIESAISAGETGTCAVFYDRSSQFFIALARFCQANAEDIAPCENGSTALVSLAREALISTNATEIAEFIVALKMMTHRPRPLEQTALIDDLTQRLRTFIVESDLEAHLLGDSVFLGQSPIGVWAGRKINWISPAQSTATALLALVLP